MTIYSYWLFDPYALTPTEDVDASRLAVLEAKLLSDGRWTHPIAAHENAHFVMDGHHRLTVAKHLKLRVIPVVFTGYDDVEVTAWRPGETITPEHIFALVRSGRLYPCKTTRHIFKEPLPSCDIPLVGLGFNAPKIRGVLPTPLRTSL